eukprot:scaffold40082_cov65-Phaeocystis_antarctica.AAC.2
MARCAGCGVHGACSAALLPAYHASASKPRTRSAAQRVTRATVSNPGPTRAAMSCRSRPSSRSAYAARAVRQAPLRSSSRVSPASTDRAASAESPDASTTLEPIPTLCIDSHSVRPRPLAADSVASRSEIGWSIASRGTAQTWERRVGRQVSASAPGGALLRCPYAMVDFEGKT